MVNKIPSTCPVCLRASNSKFKQSYRSEDKVFSLFECSSCMVQFWSPFKNPGKDWYESVYGEEDYNRNDEQTPIRPGFRFFISKWRHQLKDKEILDFGCGSGVFLDLLRKNGVGKLWGLDLNKYAIAGLQKRGYKNIFLIEDTNKLPKILLQKKFDYITAFEVFEHLDNNLAFLNLLKKNIDENGILALSVPYRGRMTVGIDIFDYPPNHLTRWNKKAITNILNLAEFEVLKIRRVDDYDLTLNAFNRLIGPFLVKPDYRQDFSGIKFFKKARNGIRSLQLKFAFLIVIILFYIKNLLYLGNTLYVEAQIKK